MGAIYVGKKLGAGGFEMEVVLKQLLPEFTQQEEFIDLFLREAKLSATLDHANIVHTIDLVTAGGEYFIVMEYLPGGDLRTLLKKAKRRGKRFSPAAAIYICARGAVGAGVRARQARLRRQAAQAHPPRRVAVEHPGLVLRRGEADRLRHREGGDAQLAVLQGEGQDRLHVARAGEERAARSPLAICTRSRCACTRSSPASACSCTPGLTTSAEEIYSQPVPLLSRKVPGPAAGPRRDHAEGARDSIPTTRYQTAGEFQEALMRCAHRNGLLMSAPELARELLERVRPDRAVARRRRRRRSRATSRSAPAPRSTTAGDDDDEDDDDDGRRRSAPVSIHSIALRAHARRERRAISRRPRPRSTSSQGVELTSIINMMDLDDARARGRSSISTLAPALDSGPRAASTRVRVDSIRRRSTLVRPWRGRVRAPPPPSDEPRHGAGRADVDAAAASAPASRRRRAAPRRPTPRQRSAKKRVRPVDGDRRADRARAASIALIVAMSGPDVAAPESSAIVRDLGGGGIDTRRREGYHRRADRMSRDRSNVTALLDDAPSYSRQNAGGIFVVIKGPDRGEVGPPDRTSRCRSAPARSAAWCSPTRRSRASTSRRSSSATRS